MPALFGYLRQHPWQRRALTSSAALVFGGVAALIALPHVQDWLLLRDLGSEQLSVRNDAISRAIRRAADSPRTLRSLNEALDTASDRQFSAIIAVLKWLGKFNVPGRKGEQVDRMWAMEVSGNPEAENRAIFLAEMLLAGRDNRYVRRGLAGASGDEAAEVRGLSATLAARLGDDAALAGLLADADPNVAAAAALNVGVARRAGHAEALRKMLALTEDDTRRSAAAYGLARTDPNEAAGLLAPALMAADRAGNEALRDRLLHVMCECPSAAARAAVLGVLARSRAAGKPPPAMAMIAAGKLKLTEATADVRKVLVEAVEGKGKLTVGQVHAALLTAERLGMPVRKEVEAVCRKLWSFRPSFRGMLTTAARLLAAEAARPQDDRPDEPSPAECVRTLRLAAVYDYLPTTAPAGERPKLRSTPLPSAAAAVGLWQLRTQAADEFLRNSAGEQTTLPGDYVSWHLGTSGEPRALEFALTLLPALDAPPDERVYNDEMRGTGAMLLGLAPRTAAQRAEATQRVRSRLVGGKLGGESNFYVRGALQCALTILGDPAAPAQVTALLETGQFSQRRAVTALTLSGRLGGLDWILWNPQVGADDAIFLLVDERIGDILATCVPEAPAVDAAIGEDLSRWQLEILRNWYAIHRSRIRVRWPVDAPTRRGLGAASSAPATMPAP